MGHEPDTVPGCLRPAAHPRSEPAPMVLAQSDRRLVVLPPDRDRRGRLAPGRALDPALEVAPERLGRPLLSDVQPIDLGALAGRGEASKASFASLLVRERRG